MPHASLPFPCTIVGLVSALDWFANTDLRVAAANLARAQAGQVEIEGHGLITDEPLSAEEQSDEYLLMGLRLREGVDIHRYEALSGRRLARSQIDSLAADGFVTEANGRIMVTPVGAPFLDTIVADLAA